MIDGATILPMEITLKLKLQDVQSICAVLAKLPYDQVFLIIKDIERQINEQALPNVQMPARPTSGVHVAPPA